MNVSHLALIATAILLGAAAPPSGDAMPGAAIVAHGTPDGVLPCMACHGPDLMGNASIGAPRIAGLPETATLAAFQAIAAGKTGSNFVMRHIAGALTPEQRQEVAAWLATLKPPR